jgi:hypothetical protein
VIALASLPCCELKVRERSGFATSTLGPLIQGIENHLNRDIGKFEGVIVGGELLGWRLGRFGRRSLGFDVLDRLGRGLRVVLGSGLTRRAALGHQRAKTDTNQSDAVECVDQEGCPTEQTRRGDGCEITDATGLLYDFSFSVQLERGWELA